MFAIFSVMENKRDMPFTTECVREITFEGLICRLHGTVCLPNKISEVKKRKMNDPKGECKFMIMCT